MNNALLYDGKKPPELASALAALIAAHKNLPVTEVESPGEGETKTLQATK